MEIALERLRNESVLSPWPDGERWGERGQHNQPERGLDGISHRTWSDASQRAANGLATGYSLSPLPTEPEQDGLTEPPQTPWESTYPYGMCHDSQLWPDPDPGIACPRYVSDDFSELSPWSRQPVLVAPTNAPTFAAQLAVSGSMLNIATLNRTPNEGAIGAGPDQEISHSWSQASSILESGSGDDIVSEMSPQTPYTGCSLSGIRFGATHAGFPPASRTRQCSVLDGWWKNGCEAEHMTSPSEAVPDLPLDDTDFSALGLTWFDEMLNEGEEVASSPYGNAPRLSERPTLGPFDLGYPTLQGEEYSLAPVDDGWLTGENLSWSQSNLTMNDGEQLAILAKSCEMGEMNRKAEARSHIHAAGLSRPRDSWQTQDARHSDRSGTSVIPRACSTRNKPHRVRVQPRSRCIQRPQAKDLFLVQSKLAGMSYREIRDRGKFTEAESTLRGRFRTLTKSKESRVRKPGWEERDVHLLVEAVGRVRERMKTQAGGASQKGSGKGLSSKDLKIPWKQVAEHIAQNGGSYHFGNATCRKKWDEIRATTSGDEQDEGVDS
ncbi:MAG: hypothetical protein M1826_000617 [Phylliscum demangeonii]|nr:MAG: hypothetical protein M1826_000617 [Phylliscum demangeonii]